MPVGAGKRRHKSVTAKEAAASQAAAVAASEVAEDPPGDGPYGQGFPAFLNFPAAAAFSQLPMLPSRNYNWQSQVEPAGCALCKCVMIC